MKTLTTLLTCFALVIAACASSESKSQVDRSDSVHHSKGTNYYQELHAKSSQEPMFLYPDFGSVSFYVPSDELLQLMKRIVGVTDASRALQNELDRLKSEEFVHAEFNALFPLLDCSLWLEANGSGDMNSLRVDLWALWQQRFPARMNLFCRPGLRYFEEEIEVSSYSLVNS